MSRITSIQNNGITMRMHTKKVIVLTSLSCAIGIVLFRLFIASSQPIAEFNRPGRLGAAELLNPQLDLQRTLGTSRSRDEFNELIRSIARLDESQRGEAAENVCEAIMRSFDSGDLLARQRVHELWGVFRRDVRREGFERIANQLAAGPDDFVKEDALRVLAERARGDGNLLVAERLLNERVVVARKLLVAGEIQKNSVSLAEYDLAALLAEQKRWKEAFDVCREAPSLPVSNTDHERAGAWYEFKSMLAERSGDRGASVETLRSLLQNVPDFGAATGRDVEIHAKIIELMYSDHDPGKAHEFLLLWDTAKHRDVASILSVGNNAAVLLKGLDPAASLRVVTELDQRFQDLWDSLAESQQNSYVSQRLSTRIKLAESHIIAGELDKAFELLVDISKKLPNASANERFLRTIDLCRPHP
ncbi:MAG: hypothetical protein K2Y21_16065 [Phycisphaerales bacterium]|nr:hypothetical protein [Phycisphaerales bacterium]